MIRILIGIALLALVIWLIYLVRKAFAATFEFRMEARRMYHQGQFKHSFLKETERILIDEDVRNAKIRGFGSGPTTRLEISGDEGIERAAQRIRNTFQMLH